MKKLLILTVSFLITLNIGLSFGQGTKNYASNSFKKEKRIEKRGDRREIRKLEGTRVSNVSMESFSIDFARASDVNWERTPDYDVATFQLKGQQMKAYYDADGMLAGTIQYKNIEDLPDKGQKILNKKYSDYSIGKILFFNNNEMSKSPMLLWGTEIVDRSCYFVELANGTKKMVLYVDPGGNVKLFKQL